jgi:hypothetical protein
MYYAKPICLPWLKCGSWPTWRRRYEWLMITNPTHPIWPFCVDLKITDEYVHRPSTPKPLLYVKASADSWDVRKTRHRPEKNRKNATDDHGWKQTSTSNYVASEVVPATNVFARNRPVFYKTSTNTISRFPEYIDSSNNGQKIPKNTNNKETARTRRRQNNATVGL